MKLIKTVDAIGHVLCHDITQIIKDEKKGVLFHKGHVVTEEDIPKLLTVGKEHLYIWEKNENMLHENEAAQIIYETCKSSNMRASAIREGKIDFIADNDGLVKINVALLYEINKLGELIMATIHTDTPVKKGDKIASSRIIPLVIEKDKINSFLSLVKGKKLFDIMPYNKMNAGLVTTGGEIFHGRIKDSFGPVIKEKLAEYGVEVTQQVILDDKPDEITAAVIQFIENGADLVVCTGGMSVDPDDNTPLAIKNTGARIVRYGSPVLPGAMFLMAYYKGVPVVGLPGCAMYCERTIFDLMLPRIVAGDEISYEDIARLGHGGLCLTCGTCHFPNCGFGK